MLKIKNELNGWLFVDKPSGITSFDVIRLLKKTINPKKIGHGGTLDPLAEGVLPIALGIATKTVDYVMNKDKYYEFIIQFGIQTNTLDSQGDVIKRDNYFPKQADIQDILARFLGTIWQTPPAFSAVKIKGRRAYALARRGCVFSIPPRQVTIKELKLLEYDALKHRVKLAACVGKGTFIRSLAVDIAQSLNALGNVVYLRRTHFGFNKEIVLITNDMLYNEQEVRLALITVEDMLDDILAYHVEKKEARMVLNGDLRFLRDDMSSFFGIFKIIYKSKIIALTQVKDGKASFLSVFTTIYKGEI